MAETVLSLADKPLAMFPSSFEGDMETRLRPGDNKGLGCSQITGPEVRLATMVITISVTPP